MPKVTTESHILLNTPPHPQLIKKYFGIRTLKKGGIRYRLEFETEPLVLSQTIVGLGQELAEAYQGAVKRKIMSVSQSNDVSDTTKAWRRKVGFDPKGKTLKKRFTSRTIESSPIPWQEGWLYHSGLFHNGIKVGKPRFSKSKQVGVWTINVTANRLREDLFGPGWETFVRKLIAFLEPEKITKEDAKFQDANRSTMKQSMKVYGSMSAGRGSAKRPKESRIARVQSRSLFKAFNITNRMVRSILTF